ncbi:MAG: fibronectin type III domain-containing protein [Actinomycetes bacterium]
MPLVSRVVLCLSFLGCTAVGSLTPLVSARAFAAAPAPVTVTPTAARHFGDGGPGLAALINVGAATELADGTIVFYDRDAHTLRSVDPGTGVITAIAGTGAVPPAPPSPWRCHIDTTSPATGVYISGVSGVWSDTAGDVFIWTGGSCDSWGNVYRLAHSGGAFQLVVSTPQSTCCSSPFGDYTDFAVDGAGDVFASDTVHSVIRKYAPDASPSSAGAIVAGILDSPGTSGDGGAATSAHINPGALAASADGTLYLSGGHTIRRIDASTQDITTVAGTGAQTPSGQPSVDDGLAATAARIDVRSMTVGQDDGNVYFEDDSGIFAAIRAFAVAGTIRTAVGPARFDSAGDPTLMATLFGERAGQVVGAGSEAMRSWPADGSKATQSGTRVVGLDDATGVGRSADGAPLSDAFLPGLNAIAQAPDGSLTLATPTAIRNLSGLAATDTIGTVAAEGAGALAYASDGTLYFTTGNGSADNPFAIDVRAPNGSIQTLLGRGVQPLSEGELGTDVSMHQITSFALDETAATLYFTSAPWSSSVWAIDLNDDTVHVFAGSSNPNAGWAEGAQARNVWLGEPADIAVDPTTHAVFLIDRGPIPVELLRVDGDGSIHDLGCTNDCLYGGLHVSNDGTVYVGGTLSPLVALHPAGSTAQVVPDLAGPFGFLANGDIVGTPRLHQGDEPAAAGGLLAVSGSISNVGFTDEPATVVAQASGNAVNVTVTPPAQQDLEITLFGSEDPAATVYPEGTAFGTVVRLASFTTDGTGTPQSFMFSKLAPQGGSGPALVLGRSYRFAVFTTEQAGLVSVSAAPQVATATPVAVAPTAPTRLHGYVANDTAYLSWTAPPDDGGAAVIGYQITVSPACGACHGLTATADQTNTAVTGLAQGTTYEFTVAADNSVGTGQDSGTLTLQDVALFEHADFTGDGVADVAVFRASTGTWYIRGLPSVRFGAAGDVPVPADYTGDGVADVAVFRASTGTWYIRDLPSVRFGAAGDVPVPADYTGDGVADVAVFRASTGTWYFRGHPSVRLGSVGDLPTVGDFNGDGRSDVAVWRPSSGTWFVQGKPSVRFGSTGDVPVPADYTGDRAADIAVWRPASGTWFVQGKPSVRFGSTGDVPVPADYTGDRAADMTVFRPSTATWYVRGRPSIRYGAVGDLAV